MEEEGVGKVDGVQVGGRGEVKRAGEQLRALQEQRNRPNVGEDGVRRVPLYRGQVAVGAFLHMHPRQQGRCWGSSDKIHPTLPPPCWLIGPNRSGFTFGGEGCPKKGGPC